MPHIEWNDEMSLNIKEIDEQHKKWIAIHNRLHDVLTQGSYNEVEKTATETLYAMQEYTRTHFQFEEEYMFSITYPDLIAHRRIHKDFDNKIYQYYREMLDGRIVLNSTIMKMIKGWLLEHIMHEDKKISDHLKKVAQTT